LAKTENNLFGVKGITENLMFNIKIKFLKKILRLVSEGRLSKQEIRVDSREK